MQYVPFSKGKGEGKGSLLIAARPIGEVVDGFALLDKIECDMLPKIEDSLLHSNIYHENPFTKRMHQPTRFLLPNQEEGGKPTTNWKRRK